MGAVSGVVKREEGEAAGHVVGERGWGGSEVLRIKIIRLTLGSMDAFIGNFRRVVKPISCEK